MGRRRGVEVQGGTVAAPVSLSQNDDSLLDFAGTLCALVDVVARARRRTSAVSARNNVCTRKEKHVAHTIQTHGALALAGCSRQLRREGGDALVGSDQRLRSLRLLLLCGSELQRRLLLASQSASEVGARRGQVALQLRDGSVPCSHDATVLFALLRRHAALSLQLTMRLVLLLFQLLQHPVQLHLQLPDPIGVPTGRGGSRGWSRRRCRRRWRCCGGRRCSNKPLQPLRLGLTEQPIQRSFTGVAIGAQGLLGSETAEPHADKEEHIGLGAARGSTGGSGTSCSGGS